MHYFDVFVLTIVGLSALFGIRRGLVEEMLKIVGLVVAILLALRFVDLGARELAHFFNTTPEKLMVVSFLLIIVLVMLAFKMLAISLKRLLHFAMMGWVDRAGGAIFGAGKALIVISILLWALFLLPAERYMEGLEQDTITYPLVLGVAPFLYDGLVTLFPGTDRFIEKVQRYIPGSNSGKSLVRFNHKEPIDRLREQLGDEVDPEILKDFSEEKIQELLENPELQKELKRRVLKYKQERAPDADSKQDSEPRKKVSKVF